MNRFNLQELHLFLDAALFILSRYIDSSGLIFKANVRVELINCASVKLP
ncbi:hypothetical protein ACIQ34_11085 [Ureibacillus sp. NPDC094379]